MPWLAVPCVAEPGTPGEAQVITQETNCPVEMSGVEPGQAQSMSAGLVPLLQQA